MNERMEGKKQEQIEGRKNGCKGVRREGWMEEEKRKAGGKEGREEEKGFQGNKSFGNHIY